MSKLKGFSRTQVLASRPAFAGDVRRYFEGEPVDAAPILAACALLRHALLIADDDEIRDRSRPLAFFRLRAIVAALKGGAFAYCWRAGGGDAGRDRAFGWVAGLLRDLHARSTRRPFARAALWLVDAADERRVLDEVDAGASPRAARLLRRLPFVVPFRERARLFARRVAPEGGSNAAPRKLLQLRFNMTLYESMRAIIVSRSRELVQR